MSADKIDTAAHVVAEVTFKPQSEGGRPLMPLGDGYAPYLRTQLTDRDLAVRINKVPDGAKHGDTIRVIIELSYYPKFDYGNLTEGTSIQLIEGPRIVAEGRCLSGIINGS